MPKRFRFTGESPPPRLWKQYPNWRNAYEEEGKEDQDETTLMPHEVQTCIGRYTSFTGGRVRFNDGRQYPAFLSLGEAGIDGCEVYEKAKPWRIYYCYPDKKWVSFREEWLPKAERRPSVSLDDNTIFPLEIHMAVPWNEGGQPRRYRITKGGEMHEISA